MTDRDHQADEDDRAIGYVVATPDTEACEEWFHREWWPRFAARWPEAEVVDLLDASLSVDRAKDHDLTPRMFERFVELGGYAHRLGAEAILVTCSAFGPAIERMARELPIPVLKPNEAMIRQAFARGGKVGLLSTFALRCSLRIASA